MEFLIHGIIEALAQQNKPKQTNERIILDDGLLSISDAVFGCALYKAGYTDIDDYISTIALCDRDKFLKQIVKEL